MGERLSLSAAFKVMQHKDNLRFNMLEAAFAFREIDIPWRLVMFKLEMALQEHREWIRAAEVYERWFGSAKTK